MRALRRTLLATTILLIAGSPMVQARTSESIDADSLARRARGGLAQRSPESRRHALEDFERAASLDPDRAERWIELGSACATLGRLALSRTYLTRATRLAPEAGPPRTMIGQSWMQDWLASLEPKSFLLAV